MLELTSQERKVVKNCVESLRKSGSSSCLWTTGSLVCIGFAVAVFVVGVYYLWHGRQEAVASFGFERAAWLAVWTLTIMAFGWQCKELRAIVAKLACGADPGLEEDAPAPEREIDEPQSRGPSETAAEAEKEESAERAADENEAQEAVAADQSETRGSGQEEECGAREASDEPPAESSPSDNAEPPPSDSDSRAADDA